MYAKMPAAPWSCRKWATRRDTSASLSLHKRNGPWQQEVARVVEGDGMAEMGSQLVENAQVGCMSLSWVRVLSLVLSLQPAEGAVQHENLHNFLPG